MDSVWDSLNNWGEEKKRCLILNLEVEHWPLTKQFYSMQFLFRNQNSRFLVRFKI